MTSSALGGDERGGGGYEHNTDHFHNSTVPYDTPFAKQRLPSRPVHQMAPAGTSSPVTLDPPVLPQVSFARADDLLVQAALLRAEAEAMKAAMESNYDKALQCEKSAVELQANAEKDRKYVQAGLDTTLEYNSDVLEHFVLAPHNEQELKRLTTSVEEGKAYMHEVISLGERLRHFKATKLELSKPTGDNPSSGISKVQHDLASSSQLTIHSQAFQQAPSPPTNGIAFWGHRINSLLGRRFSDVQYSPRSSLISGKNGETTVETRNKNIGSLHQEQTIDDLGCGNNEAVKACSSPKNTSTDLISTGFLQDAMLPPRDDSTVINAVVEDQIESRGIIFTAESTTAHTPSMIQSHTEEDFIPLGSPRSDIPIPNDLKKRASEAITTQPVPKRGLTKAEKAATFNEHKILARYRELVVSEQGPNDGKVGRVKRKIKKEMQTRIENDDAIPLERKEKLISYGLSKTSELIDGENRHNQPKPPKTDTTTLKRLKRKRSESTTTQPATQPAAKRRRRAKTGTEEEMAAIFNEPETLARFRELFVGTEGNNKVKKTRAKKAMKLEVKRKILQEGTLPRSKKQAFFLYGKQQINLLARREAELRNRGRLESRRTAERHQSAEISDLTADEGRTEEDEREGSAERRAIYPTEMSDVSVDDAQWP
jgi:hypothetical protein